jgi:uncharacterized Tic20 family protein
MQETKSAQEVMGDGGTTDKAVRVPTDEWTAASLAHASVLLTLILGLAGGVGALVGLAVPLVMYFGYREESRFVAFHALQSFVYQVIGTVIGAGLFFLVAAAWTISGWLTLILVGFLLMPLALLLTLQLVCVIFGWLGCGLYAAYQVYQGRDFRYGLIGEWLEKEEVRV